jgi:hypothetical protein
MRFSFIIITFALLSKYEVVGDYKIKLSLTLI